MAIRFEVQRAVGDVLVELDDITVGLDGEARHPQRLPRVIVHIPHDVEVADAKLLRRLARKADHMMRLVRTGDCGRRLLHDGRLLDLHGLGADKDAAPRRFLIRVVDRVGVADMDVFAVLALLLQIGAAGLDDVAVEIDVIAVIAEGERAGVLTAILADRDQHLDLNRVAVFGEVAGKTDLQMTVPVVQNRPVPPAAVTDLYPDNRVHGVVGGGIDLHHHIFAVGAGRAARNRLGVGPELRFPAQDPGGRVGQSDGRAFLHCLQVGDPNRVERLFRRLLLRSVRQHGEGARRRLRLVVQHPDVVVRIQRRDILVPPARPRSVQTRVAFEGGQGFKHHRRSALRRGVLHRQAARDLNRFVVRHLIFVQD